MIFFQNMTHRIAPFFLNLTHRIELFFLIWLKELYSTNWTLLWHGKDFVLYTWLKKIKKILNMTPRIEPTLEYDSKNWTFFPICLNDLDFFFWTYSKNWSFFENDSKIWTFFHYDSIIEPYFKLTHIIELFLNTPQRIQPLFFLYECKELTTLFSLIWLKGFHTFLVMIHRAVFSYDSKNSTYVENVTRRIYFVFFENY